MDTVFYHKAIRKVLRVIAVLIEADIFFFWFPFVIIASFTKFDQFAWLKAPLLRVDNDSKAVYILIIFRSPVVYKHPAIKMFPLNINMEEISFW